MKKFRLKSKKTKRKKLMKWTKSMLKLCQLKNRPSWRRREKRNKNKMKGRTKLTNLSQSLNILSTNRLTPCLRPSNGVTSPCTQNLLLPKSKPGKENSSKRPPSSWSCKKSLKSNTMRSDPLWSKTIGTKTNVSKNLKIRMFINSWWLIAQIKLSKYILKCPSSLKQKVWS